MRSKPSTDLSQAEIMERMRFKGKGKRNNREYQIAKQLSIYLRSHPKKPLFHWDLAGQNLSKAQAGMMKALNERGFPDLVIYYPREIGYDKVGREITDGSYEVGNYIKKWYGLCLEIKREGTKLFKKDGKLFATPHLQEQADYHLKLMEMGYYTMFAIGLDECILIIDQWLK